MNDLRKTQLCQLDMALEVDRICKEYNLKYFLVGGTLLGAVRHKGFIPWDDDLDLGMPRDDYEKFLQLCGKDDILDSHFTLQNWDNDQQFGFGFAKLRIKGTHYVEKMSEKSGANDGIFIDIFPFDYSIQDQTTLKSNIRSFYFWSRMYMYKKNYDTWTNTLSRKVAVIAMRLMALLFSGKQIKERIKKIESAGDPSSGFFINYWGCYKERDVIGISSIENWTTLNFEGYELCSPGDWNEMLKTLYGNYMKLPPIETRENRHQISNVDFGNYVPRNDRYKTENAW